MVSTKPFQNYEDLLTLLGERGMRIADLASAEESLRNIGYYRLSGYWYPFREPFPNQQGAAERVGEVPKRWRRKRVLIRVYCTFYGQRIVLLLGGYNKLRDPSRKQEQKEIRAARSVLSAWKRE